MRLKKMLKYSLLIAYSITFLSCNHKQKTDEVLGFESIIKNTIGKELFIPKNVEIYSPFSNYLADSSRIAKAPFKIYSRIEASCGTCITHVESWNNLAVEFKNHNIPIILIFHSNDKFELIKHYCESGIINKFPYPFFLDAEDEFKKNEFMLITKNFETVLTDKENNIIAMGNPTRSSEIKDLYLNEIQKRLKK